MRLHSQMLTRLQIETRTLHPEADALWVELMSEATRECYVSTLITTYGFEAPIEAAVAMTAGVNNLLSLRPRTRSGFIVQDLLELGLSPSRIARLPHCSRVVPCRDVSEALGWIYAVERSTLLHESVHHHLAARLPSVRAWSYLSAHRDVAAQRWQELGQALELVELRYDTADQIVAGARSAFAILREWVERDQAPLLAQAAAY